MTVPQVVTFADREELSRPVDHDLAEVEARGITEGGRSRWGDLAGPRDEW